MLVTGLTGVRMWHTSRGDRTLSGSEAKLIANAVETMIDALLLHIDVDWVDEGGVYQTGITLFDSLTPSQRIVVLHDVTKHLLTETEETLPLSALVEASVAAIFVEVRDQVAIEIGLYRDDLPASNPPSLVWRQSVRNAFEDVIQKASEAAEGVEWEPSPEDLEMPEVGCNEIVEWERLIDSLADSILWDRDFEMADSFLDADPDHSQARRELLGIDDEYFLQVPDDPPSYEAMRLASMTRQIVRAKPR